MPNKKAKITILTVIPFMAGLGVLLLTPSPIYLLHRLNAMDILPPLWILTVLHLAWYAATGALLGRTMTCSPFNRATEGDLWRGCTGVILGTMLLSVWYILLFGKGILFLAWFFIPLCVGAILLSALSLHTLRGFSIWLYLPCIAWPLFLSILHLLVLLQA